MQKTSALETYLNGIEKLMLIIAAGGVIAMLALVLLGVVTSYIPFLVNLIGFIITVITLYLLKNKKLYKYTYVLTVMLIMMTLS